MPDLKEIYLKALDSHLPDLLVRKALEKHLKYEGGKSLYLLSIGKASVKMAQGVFNKYGDEIADGIIIAPEGSHNPHGNPFQVVLGSHPTPDGNSLKAGQELIKFIRNIPENAVLLMLISGGASSLAVQLVEGISIQELEKVYKLLINSGADIYEMNSVRKHLSKIKGGLLIKYLNPAVNLFDFIISDVPGDDLEVIGSGLTIPDSSTFEDAKKVLTKYKLWNKLPGSVREYIENGVEGDEMETIKPGEDPVQNHQSYLVGSARLLAQSLVNEFQALGYQAVLANEYYSGDVEKVAGKIAGKAISRSQNKSENKPQVLVFYGESTVNVTGEGKGGRNQELALRAALKIEGYPNITWMSIGTDGIDGPTDAAGALVNGNTISEAKEKGMNPEKFLADNNSYNFHKKMNTLIKTGPTGNNLMDLQIVVIK